MLSQGESMQTLHTNVQKILATFVCSSKSQFTEWQAWFCWKLNSVWYEILDQNGKGKCRNQRQFEAQRIWVAVAISHLVFLFASTISPSALLMQLSPDWIFLKFQMFSGTEKDFISISTTSRCETRSYVGWNHTSREAACSHTIWWPYIIPGIQQRRLLRTSCVTTEWISCPYIPCNAHSRIILSASIEAEPRKKSYI